MPMFGKKVLTISILMTMLAAVPAWGELEVGPERLETNGKILGDVISEAEMDHLRGGYMGFHLSVLFEGGWDTLGNANGALTTDATGPGNPAGANLPALPAGTAVNIQATVGEMAGARGIFQITQVPGSGNVVTSNMIINIQIVQVPEAVLSNLPLLPWQ